MKKKAQIAVEVPPELLEAMLRPFLDEQRKQHRQILRLLRNAIGTRESLTISDLTDQAGRRKTVAEARLAILDQWEKALAQAARRGEGHDAATRRFLTRLQTERGLRISRSTLYRWGRVLRRRGLQGLMDGRSEAVKICSNVE